MMKKVLHGISIVLLCFPFSLRGQEVKIRMDHPEKVNAGFEFTVTVTIQKGALTDYSRFSQDLPLGLTATNISSPNADFSFDNQRIRIIWLKLPEQNEVRVSYNIMVDERLKGSFVLGGVFAYVVGDERKFINFEESKEITIIPNPEVDPSRLVDIMNFQKDVEARPGITDQGSYAMVIRQKPVLLGSGGYLIKLLVKKPEGSKYAKIEENIPSGYLYEQVDTHDAIVSFAASTVKFIWMKLPQEAEFELSYKLVPKRDEPQSDMVVEGVFTYTEGDETQNLEVKQVDADFEDLTLAEKRRLLQTGEVPPGTRKSGETTAGSTAATEAHAGTTTTNVQTRPGDTPPDRTAPFTGTVGSTPVLPPQTGVYYRVQLIATEIPFDANALFAGEGIDREVYVEQHEGLYKYTAGSFSSYEQASAYRDRIERSLPSADGPFVVKYRDGRRITGPAGNR
jgi:hypothetical protein